jgi:hypothetical protein
VSDLIDRTARQVRLPGGDEIHRMTGAATLKDTGRTYRTGCAQMLPASAGAVLTTRRVSCALCTAGDHHG